MQLWKLFLYKMMFLLFSWSVFVFLLKIQLDRKGEIINALQQLGNVLGAHCHID